jgi:hypothetical protein
MVFYDYLRLIFSGMLGALPLLLVWLAGAGLAIGRWKRHPRVSRTALTGFLLMIFSIILNALWLAIYGDISAGQPPAFEFVFATDLAASLILFSLQLGGFILVVLAVFGGRRGQPGLVQQKSEEAAS